jgi:hypothetical protein
VTNQRLPTTKSGKAAGSDPRFPNGARILRGSITGSKGRVGGDGGGPATGGPEKPRGGYPAGTHVSARVVTVL